MKTLKNWKSFNESLTKSEDESSFKSLLDYFENTWSKDELLIKQVRHNPNLKERFGKYLNYTKEDWANTTKDELKDIWLEWEKMCDIYIKKEKLYENIKKLSTI